MCNNRYQSTTAVHNTHPQYSHYDPRTSVGTLSDLLGCSSPSEHSAITYPWFLDCHIIFIGMAPHMSFQSSKWLVVQNIGSGIHRNPSCLHINQYAHYALLCIEKECFHIFTNWEHCSSLLLLPRCTIMPF